MALPFIDGSALVLRLILKPRRLRLGQRSRRKETSRKGLITEFLRPEGLPSAQPELLASPTRQAQPEIHHSRVVASLLDMAPGAVLAAGSESEESLTGADTI